MQEHVANLGPRERRRRLIHGIVWLAVAVAAALGLAGMALWLRTLVFLPLLGAMVGVFQYLEKT